MKNSLYFHGSARVIYAPTPLQVDNDRDLREKLVPILRNNVPVILQEVIAGPDTNHLKYCSYTSSDGKRFAEFTLRKIRQYPVRFGVGSAVESIQNAELIKEGRKLFSGIGFKAPHYTQLPVCG
ncbi:hypothetical protein [Thiocystis minor]|uniref:hypothetical protein n=1 Tax=Thiocystis minor TaxID=61597 RepID=UPI0019139524|nr:hypothetical protein [Thiocystis minor]